MSIFSFDPAHHRETYERQGWAHIQGGVRSEFLDELRHSVTERRKMAETLHGSGIAGAKGQYIYEPPAGLNLVGELFDMVSGLAGLDRERLTLSERHIKAYDHDADPDPPAHKDRHASQVAVGVSVEVPTGSRLVLYPQTDVRPNPFLDTGLRPSLEPCELPEVILQGAPAVEISDSPGDVLIFAGSAAWHRRTRSAGAVNLYLKVNDFDSDPLAEDPSTPARRARTEAALDGLPGASSPLVPVLARRLEWFGARHGHGGFAQPMAKVWDQAPFPLSDEELELLLSLTDRKTWAVLAKQGPQVDEHLRRLSRRGVLDLLPGNTMPTAQASPPHGAAVDTRITAVG